MKYLHILTLLSFLSILLMGKISTASDTAVYPREISPPPPNTVIPKLDTPLQPSDVVAQRSALCEGVTCSDHGKCVVQDGSPVCACNEGLLPDAQTGLHCIPAQIRVINPAVQPVVQLSAHTTIQTQRLERLRLKQAMERDFQKDAKIAMREHPDYRRLRAKQGLGTTGVVLGAVTMGVAALISDPLFDFELSTTGWTVFGAGAVILLPSMIMRISAGRRLNDIYQQELKERRQAFQVKLAGITPTVLQDGKGAGVSATVQF